MSSISISKLKENPSKAIKLAEDYPLAIENRNQTEAYIVTKRFYDKLVDYFEDIIDTKAVDEYDSSTAVDFDKAVEKMGL